MPFPNGQQLISSALTPDALLATFQTLTAQMLGLNPQSDTDPAYAAVRLDWPTGGQPGWGITENIAFLQAREEDAEYSTIRDVKRSPNDAASLRSTWTYTRVWRLSWVFYGPGSFDQTRLVNDGLFLDWIQDALAASRLYFVDSGRPRYAPELFSGQWWKRTDLSATFNEAVTATIIDPTVASAEVLVYRPEGLLADIDVD
jgi:hypothetical protein